MPPDQPHNFDSRLTHLETRVESFGSTLNSVAEAITGISDKVDRNNAAINAKFEERSKPAWGLYLGALSPLLVVLGMIGYAWKAPIEGTQARQEYDIRKLQESIVPRETHETLRKQQDRENDDVRRRLERLEGGHFKG